METSQFDRFSKIFAASGSRRTLALLLAALPLSGLSPLGQEEAMAKEQRRRRRQRRHRVRKRDRVAKEKKGAGAPLCLNGEPILAKKKKKKKLLKQGATPGECPSPPPPPSPPTSPPSPPSPPPPPTCNWRFSTQIGTGARGSGNNQFSSPKDVAVSPDSLTVWVADTYNNRVMVWTRPNATSTNWSFNAQIGTGTYGDGNDEFNPPHGVAVSPDGLTAWVVDSGNDRVMVWTRPNASSTTWSFNAQIGTGVQGSGTSQFNLPMDAAVSPDGLTTWVADAFNNRVMAWTRPNVTSTDWIFDAQIGTGANQFGRPHGVAISPDGLTAWVTDLIGQQVEVWTRPNAITAWSSNAQIGTGERGSGTNQFYNPVKVAVSPDGLTVWVADILNHRVMVWTRPHASSSTWSFAAQIGTGVQGSGTNQFSSPSGVAVSPDGRTVWVADSENHRVMVWTREGCSS